MDILNQLSSLHVLALTIYGEARGECIEGQIAVGNVVKNRFIKSSAKDYNAICLKPAQFSCWNKKDKNRKLLETIANEILTGVIRNDKYLKQAIFIARGIITDALIDNVDTCKYYMTKDLFFSDKRPSWAKIPLNKPIEIGRHVFFNI